MASWTDPGDELLRRSTGPRAVLRQLLATLLGLVVSLALAWLAFGQMLPARAELQALISRTSGPGLLLSLLLMSAGMGFVALRWRALTPGRRLPPVGLTAIACSALLINYALPGPVGELAAAGLVQRRYGVPAATALAAGLYGRFLGLGMSGLGTTLIWLTGVLPIPPETARWIGTAAALIGLGAAAGGGLALYPRWLKRLSEALAAPLIRRLPERPGRWVTRLDAAVGALVDALTQLGRMPPRAWLEAALWTLCGHLSVSTGLWAGALSIGADPVWAGVVFTYLASAAAVIAMFAVPGAQLFWDGLFFTFLTTTAGVSPADALLVTVLQRLQQSLLLMLGSLALSVLLGQPAVDYRLSSSSKKESPA